MNFIFTATTINRLAQYSFSRLSSSSKVFCQAKSFHSVQKAFLINAKKSPLKNRTQLITVRWQFDFTKKPPRGNRKLPRTSKERNVSTLLYLLSLAILTTGASYAAVPLYRIFCQSSGYGGTTKVGHDTEKISSMELKKERLIKVIFNADTAATMRWNFRPQQSHVEVYPGETALAFYTAKNPTEKPIDGISTYNVIPFEAGQYFNKIQCFCFEEQRLNPNEEVDMPVFFYIDPDYVDNPFLENVDTIYLSYTFFESKPGFKLPTMN